MPTSLEANGGAGHSSVTRDAAIGVVINNVVRCGVIIGSDMILLVVLVIIHEI